MSIRNAKILQRKLLSRFLLFPSLTHHKSYYFYLSYLGKRRLLKDLQPRFHLTHTRNFFFFFVSVTILQYFTIFCLFMHHQRIFLFFLVSMRDWNKIFSFIHFSLICNSFSNILEHLEWRIVLYPIKGYLNFKVIIELCVFMLNILQVIVKGYELCRNQNALKVVVAAAPILQNKIWYLLCTLH